MSFSAFSGLLLCRQRGQKAPAALGALLKDTSAGQSNPPDLPAPQKHHHPPNTLRINTTTAGSEKRASHCTGSLTGAGKYHIQ